MKSSFAEKDPGLPGWQPKGPIARLAMSLQCACATSKDNLILGCASKSANTRESDSFHLLSVCETTSGTLCTVSGSTVQETMISWSKSGIRPPTRL